MIDKFNLHNWIYNNCFEYGDFTLKSGKKSHLYIDLRKAYSNPEVLKAISCHLAILIKDSKIKKPKIIGVPYGGIPYASCISLMNKIPQLMIRKEDKKHGKKKVVEGDYKEGDQIILIEDTVTTGGSILDTIMKLNKEGLVVRGVFTIMNRCENLEKMGKELDLYTNSIFQLNDFRKSKEIIYYKLLSIKENKKTNLIFSADIDNEEKMLKAVEKIASKIACVKVHSDIYDNPTETLKKLWAMSQTHNFLVFEDRKFADISNTTNKQLSKIAKYVHLVTTHTISGEGIISSFEKYEVPVLLIAELSTKNNLISPNYTKRTYEIGEKHSKTVLGYICQNPRELKEKQFNFIPGISLTSKGDQVDQQYNKPKKGGDFFIVGRGIYKEGNILENAEKYRKYCLKV